MSPSLLSFALARHKPAQTPKKKRARRARVAQADLSRVVSIPAPRVVFLV